MNQRLESLQNQWPNFVIVDSFTIKTKLK